MSQRESAIILVSVVVVILWFTFRSCAHIANPPDEGVAVCPAECQCESTEYTLETPY
jgi:hypothetical protein